MKVQRLVVEANIEGEPSDEIFYIVGRMKIATKRGVRDIEKTVTTHKTVTKSDLESNFDTIWRLIGEDIKREIDEEIRLG